MRVTKPVILAVLAAGALGSVTQSGATPAPLTPGGSVNPIPTYSGPTPTFDVLHDTGLQTMTGSGMTVQFEEWAVNTNLNPSGVVFAFAINTSNNPSSLGATLPGYANFMTSVEACAPFSAVTTCAGAAATGMAARSMGTGDTLTFSSLGTTAVSPPVGSPTYVSNLNAIFTNASGWTDPSVTVMVDGSSFTFEGIAPKTSSSVPEPATLGLFALGLLGTGLARRSHRH
jgi:hypothetical protein